MPEGAPNKPFVLILDVGEAENGTHMHEIPFQLDEEKKTFARKKIMRERTGLYNST